MDLLQPLLQLSHCLCGLLSLPMLQAIPCITFLDKFCMSNRASVQSLTCALAKGLSIALPESPKGLAMPFTASLLPIGKAAGCCKGGGRKRLRLVVLLALWGSSEFWFKGMAAALSCSAIQQKAFRVWTIATVKQEVQRVSSGSYPKL